jgi:uncharacterized membrane protein YuzA (DUF378 family)
MGQKEYIKKKLYGLAILILVLSGFNWGFVAIFKTDVVSSLFGKDSLISRLFFIFIVFCAIYVGISRDSYLPFLGETVLPCSALQEKIPDKAELKVRIIAPIGHKVIYWAAEPGTSTDGALKNWQDAYGNFENVGVAIAESDGSALLQVRRPQPYWVPLGHRLEPHVHYRICGKNGMLGPVRSLFIEERVEGFGTAVHIK